VIVIRTTLNLVFNEQLGRNVINYLVFYRINIACEALSLTNLSLTEISEATGFKYDTYFIKQFTAKMDMSPTQYRQIEWARKDKKTYQ
jgi:AraC-like DNA-binding protein